jgi:hypothetical protein
MTVWTPPRPLTHTGVNNPTRLAAPTAAIHGIDPSAWTTTAGASISGNVLTIVETITPEGAITNTTYNLTGSSFSARGVPVYGSSVSKIILGTASTIAGIDTGNVIEWYGNGGAGTWRPYTGIAGAYTPQAAALAVPTGTYFRIREAAGTIFCTQSSSVTTRPRRPPRSTRSTACDGHDRTCAPRR